MDEFFDQGDLEKESGFNVSFLCDRNNTQIPGTQPGFINFIVLPLFRCIEEIMPSMSEMVKQGEANAVTWGGY